MFILYQYGNNIADILKPIPYQILYFLLGILSVFIYTVISTISTKGILGASGSISGIIGIYIILFPKVQIAMYIGKYFLGFCKAYIALLCYVVFQIVMYFLVERTGNSNVAFAGHFAGVIGGIVMGFIFRALGFKKYFQLKIDKENKEKGLTACPSCGNRGKLSHYGTYVCRECGSVIKYFATGIRLADEIKYIDRSKDININSKRS